MSSDTPQTPEPAVESQQRQLCVSCLFPNDPMANFCTECGAPLSSYAATGPFESLFAEGHLYRRAVEQPHRFVVVLGIWILFGTAALMGLAVLLAWHAFDTHEIALAVVNVALSIIIVVKTTRNYLNRPRTSEQSDP
jgi:hypothetical protein